MTDLIKFLRTSTSSAYNKVAADRIEQLNELLTAATDDAKKAEAYAEELEAKLTKAMAFIRRHIPDSVYEQRQRANAFLAELEGKEEATGTAWRGRE